MGWQGLGGVPYPTQLRDPSGHHAGTTCLLCAVPFAGQWGEEGPRPGLVFVEVTGVGGI